MAPAKRILPLAGLVALISTGGLPCHWAPAAQADSHAESAGGALERHEAHGAAAPGMQGVQGVQEVRVTLSEWALAPAELTVPVGSTIRFVALNAGVLPHALSIEGDGLYAESESVGSRSSVPLEVTFATAGTYDLFCPVNAGQHRALGQEGVLYVVADPPEPGEPSSLEPPDGSADPAAPPA